MIVSGSSERRSVSSSRWQSSNRSTNTSTFPAGPLKIIRRSPCMALNRRSGAYPSASNTAVDLTARRAADDHVEVADLTVRGAAQGPLAMQHDAGAAEQSHRDVSLASGRDQPLAGRHHCRRAHARSSGGASYPNPSTWVRPTRS